jgi:hypothetical protein
MSRSRHSWWNRAREIFAKWGWALLAVAGVLLAGLGLGLRLSRGPADPWAATALSFAQAILAAGMVTGVLRAAQLAGFFRDQLREVIYDDSLEGSLIDSKKAWRNLTRGLFRQRFADLPGDRLENLSVDTLIGSAEYFYETHWRQLEIDWADREAGVLRIEHRVRATLRTADLGRPVPFINRYQPEAEGSTRAAFEYTFSNAKGVIKRVTEADIETSADGGQALTVLLDPAARITVTHRTIMTQQLHSDPFLNFRSTCLWADPEIVVTAAKGSNIGFYFRAMGVPEPFAAKDGSDIDGALTGLNAQCKALCLPNQGYMIVVVTPGPRAVR